MIILAFYGLGVLLTLICMSLVARFSNSGSWILEAEEIALISIFFPMLVPFTLIIAFAIFL